jgi:hypothetical protein
MHRAARSITASTTVYHHATIIVLQPFVHACDNIRLHLDGQWLIRYDREAYGRNAQGHFIHELCRHTDSQAKVEGFCFLGSMPIAKP